MRKIIYIIVVCSIGWSIADSGTATIKAKNKQTVEIIDSL